MNNKEIHYEGWLIKSPPTKRIWRARWRRRWFTLKQGEIPEQFCLEYYTDRNCRKLKGVIDLDQCEQVDCGLRLENRKQKFQFMFDIKTPKRTYYLAADTEEDMRDWVNCICQVCHLHDTKQSNELQDENRTQHSMTLNSTMNTTTTSLHSSLSGEAGSNSRNMTTTDVLRRNGQVIEQQPTLSHQHLHLHHQGHPMTGNNSDSVYVNTDYTNRETMLCDAHFDQQHLLSAEQKQPPPSPATALYLNHSALIQAQLAASSVLGPRTMKSLVTGSANVISSAPPAAAAAAATTTTTTENSNSSSTSRFSVNNSYGVVRKIPENLVLNNQPLPDVTNQPSSVLASPALSTASGPYIPISECFSGSPKFLPDGGGTNPTTPLNNLDPKFYDTPRSHNNIGLNLTNDQSYSPKITNCGLQQMAAAAAVAATAAAAVSSAAIKKTSDSDSESVFTDDDEWTHPMPLRENVDRSTRPSDSSIENESFVLTYSQRFSKMHDEANGKLAATDQQQQLSPLPGQENTQTSAIMETEELGVTSPQTGHTLEKLAKVLKNKNNLILDFKEYEKLTRDLPQLSDTENTSPAIGPRNANSVVEESYDIPRSHQLPYYNMGQLLEKAISPHTTNPIAASTPNLMIDGSVTSLNCTGSSGQTAIVSATVPPSPSASVVSSARTLPRPHCYTNAAPSKIIEGNVFRYDFMEPSECPPVNRKLKPKVASIQQQQQQLDEKPKVISGEDKPPEEFPPAKPPILMDNLATKLSGANLQSPTVGSDCGGPMRPPSVDRKCKPNAYKIGSASTMSPAIRRSTGAPLSMVLPHETEGAIGGGFETRTLPRQQSQSLYSNGGNGNPHSPGHMIHHQHQRTASAAAAMQLHPSNNNTPTPTMLAVPLPPKQNEHKLQYFDLDVTNKPPLNRQSMSVGNLNTTPGNAAARFAGLAGSDSVARAPQASGVVYNFVDFVKTEAFKRIREERKKESECGVNNATTTNK